MSINDLDEDTKIAFVKSIDELKEPVFDDGLGDKETISEALYDYFWLMSKTKEIIFNEIVNAMSNWIIPPYIILLPQKYLSVVPKNFTYPIEFHGHKVYIVPYIRKVLVYEQA